MVGERKNETTGRDDRTTTTATAREEDDHDIDVVYYYFYYCYCYFIIRTECTSHTEKILPRIRTTKRKKKQEKTKQAHMILNNCD